MRIVQFASFYAPTSGGLRICVDELGRGYTQLGHDRVLVVPGPEDRDEITESGRRVTLASPSMFGSEEYHRLKARRRVWKLLDRLRPDVIEMHDKMQVTWLSTWAKKTGVPTVLVSHERLDAIVRDRVPNLSSKLPLVTVANRVNRALDKRADQIVTASAFSAAEFERARVSNVHRIPLGVDLNAFHPVSGNDDPFTGRPAELVLLSRLSTEKNPQLAIETLRLLHVAGVPTRLTVVGNGFLRESLAQAAGDLPVRFLGHIADRAEIARIVARADVALCPSGVETFGLATLEALACGTPVVVPPRGALKEFVADDPAAGAVRNETPGDFADGVVTLLGVHPTIRRAAARAVAHRYPWSETVRRFLDLHASLVRSAAAA